MSTLEGYYDTCGGCHDHIGGCSVHRRVTMMRVGGYYDSYGDIMSTSGNSI